MKPMPSICSMMRRSGSGASAYSSREPSSGGNGIMLNTKKPMLTCIKIVTTSYVLVPTPIPKICKKTDANTASARLVNGPASPTSATPNSSYRTLRGSNGTGLAAKIGEYPLKIRSRGSKIVVNISICFSGFSVSLPSSKAVRSPRACETHACIASWIAMETISEIRTISSVLKLDDPENMPLV